MRVRRRPVMSGRVLGRLCETNAINQYIRTSEMSLDLTTLRFLRTRSRYERLSKAIPERALDTRTQILLKDYGRYFREFPDAAELRAGPFLLMFKSVHPEVKPESLAVYEAFFRQVCEEDEAPDIESGLLVRLAGAAAAYDLADIITKYNAGDEIDLRTQVDSVLTTFDETVDRKVKDPQVRDAIEDLLEAEANDIGLTFRLPCLHEHIKAVRAGDFVVIAARPDKGKTTFMASEATHMASQVDLLYPGQGRSILWFNNEGPGKNIVMRNFQAALGVTMEEMYRLSKAKCSTPEHTAKYKHLLREEYAKALGGRPGALRVMDIHGMWNWQVEDLMRQYNPAAVIFDMVDNIKFGGEANNNGQRTDQLLEAMYQWARLMGVKYDCAVFATSQVSGDGDGLQYPSLAMLKDSKTGKQGAADVIITIGTVNDPMLINSRFIGTTKNKRVRTGRQSSPMKEVTFRGDIARYVEGT
jgi:replicative DNA helicase